MTFLNYIPNSTIIYNKSGERMIKFLKYISTFIVLALCVTNISAQSKLSISGFVDGSYFYNNLNNYNTFGLDQVEVDLEKSFKKSASLRTDIEWINNGSGKLLPKIEQGYVTFNPKFFSSLKLTFGKFNAPIGFESLDPPDMYQYSHALVFDYGLPTNLTGLMLFSKLGSGFNLSAYICNGWDKNAALTKTKTFGARLGYSSEKWGDLHLSVIRGPQNSIEKNTRNVFDLDFTLTPVKKIIIGGELNYGTVKTETNTLNWNGFLLMSHCDITDYLGLTLRYGFFNDQNGIRLSNGLPEKRQAYTIAPTFSLGNGLSALLEFRLDVSDKNIFNQAGNNYRKSLLTMAFEVTYSF